MDERFTSMAKESASMFVTLNNKITDLYKWMFGCFIGTITILGSLMTFLKLFAK
jgi:NAD/NADP transhydrogenase beta subunit